MTQAELRDRFRGGGLQVGVDPCPGVSGGVRDVHCFPCFSCSFLFPRFLPLFNVFLFSSFPFFFLFSFFPVFPFFLFFLFFTFFLHPVFPFKNFSAGLYPPLMCLWFELPTASGPKSASVLWVSTGTHTCDAPIQAGRWERQSASSFARSLRGCAGGCCRTFAVVAVLPSQLCLPAPLLDRLLWRGCRATSQTQPVSLYVTLHCCCCCVLEADVALSFGSALRGDSSYSSCCD